MDTDVPVVSAVVSIPGIDEALPARAVPSLPVTERRTLMALGFGTFVAALVFVIPPLFFP